ncbi:hypothetical protein FACS189452_02690 [Bacteroidia bacterium]|nr:hypothetical protein FACS189452_02690 [Bacteroidia bacterium]
MDIKEYNVATTHNKQNHPWEYARLNVLLNLIKQHKIVLMGGGVNLLDIGCGDAFLVTQLSKHLAGGHFYAIDTAFTEYMMATLREKYPSDNIHFCKNINEVNVVNGKIDIILLLDVIEHIENDIDFLATLHSIAGFSADTSVIITVPAYQSLFCSHDVWLGHYRRYTTTLLKKHIEQAGFLPFQAGYFFTSLLLPRLVRKGKENIFGYNKNNVTGIGDWDGGKIAFWLTKSILNVDYTISKWMKKLGIKLPGLSCYCICKSK